MSLSRRKKITCPRCKGYRSVSGKSSGPYPGSPATLLCPRCIDSSGEIWEDSLTDAEKNPPAKVWFERDDNP